MIDSTFCGVCACLHPPTARFDRLRNHRRRRNDHRLPLSNPRQTCRITQQRCRRAKPAHQPPPRSNSPVIYRRSCANQKERSLRRRAHPGIKLVNINHHRARLITCVTFAVPTDNRGSKYARRYEPLKINE